MRDPAKQPLLREMTDKEKLSAEVRAAALLHFDVTIADSSLVIEALKSESEALQRAALVAYSPANVPSSFRDALVIQKSEMKEAKNKRLSAQPYFLGTRPTYIDLTGKTFDVDIKDIVSCLHLAQRHRHTPHRRRSA